MDYCLSFDIFAQSENARLIGGEMPSATSWFGSVGARDLNVAQSVMAVQGDADAALLDLRRMASQVSSRRGGTAAARGQFRASVPPHRHDAAAVGGAPTGPASSPSR